MAKLKMDHTLSRLKLYISACYGLNNLNVNYLLCTED